MSKAIKTYQSNFCRVDGQDQCMCAVHADLSLQPVANKLNTLLTESIEALEIVEQSFLTRTSAEIKEPVIPYCHLKLIITALDQVHGLFGAIWGGIEMHEEGEQ